MNKTTPEDTTDAVSKALRRAWQLGQTYWQQADSEYTSQHKKADETQRKFDQLVEETRAAIINEVRGVDAEPVAWRHRDPAWSGWATTNEQWKANLPIGWEEEPLYPHPAPSQPAVPATSHRDYSAGFIKRCERLRMLAVAANPLDGLSILAKDLSQLLDATLGTTAAPVELPVVMNKITPPPAYACIRRASGEDKCSRWCGDSAKCIASPMLEEAKAAIKLRYTGQGAASEPESTNPYRAGSNAALYWQAGHDAAQAAIAAGRN